MTETRHGRPTAPAFWQQQIVGLREGAVLVRRKLGRLRRALTASADGSTQAALSEDARTQLLHIGAETARLRTEVDALTDHLRLLTGDVDVGAQAGGLRPDVFELAASILGQGGLR